MKSRYLINWTQSAGVGSPIASHLCPKAEEVGVHGQFAVCMFRSSGVPENRLNLRYCCWITACSRNDFS